MQTMQLDLWTEKEFTIDASYANRTATMETETSSDEDEDISGPSMVRELKTGVCLCVCVCLLKMQQESELYAKRNIWQICEHQIPSKYQNCKCSKCHSREKIIERTEVINTKCLLIMFQQ